jgi:predicted deacylase
MTDPAPPPAKPATVSLQTNEIHGRSPGPHVLITGGVHGDEFEPMAAVRRLICELAAFEARGRVTLVPVVNEPAFRRGQRTAEDGLDLARTCPGQHDGSVTERIAAELSELIRSADYYIDLHTGGTKFRILPLAGYTLHPNQSVLDRQRRMARAFGLPIVWGTDPNLNGRSLSVARDAGVPAIYCEYHGGGDCNPQGVDAYTTGCLNVLADLGVIERPPAAASGNQIVVEDDRPNSGHLQLNHPAPCEGFFDPSVGLGQRVAAGDRLGTVSNVLGDRVEPIVAHHGGIVLLLHTFSRVERGESCAVVLETDQKLPEPFA